MPASSNIFEYHERWRGPFAISATLHALVIGGALIYGIILNRPGDSWGSAVASDGAMNATLVSSAIPLPATPVEKQNVLATESKGLSESEPAKTEPEPEAIPLPDRTAKPKTQRIAPRPITKTPPKPVEQANNIVPFGQGGPVSAPYSTVKTDTGTGGMSFGANGSFGSRYSWYVDAVRRKVSENWLKYEVDPSISNAKRVYITFEIGRNGQPGNIQISQSSGVPSLDQSAKRALQRIDTFGPLPNDYSGSKVSVEFWFDYKR